MKSDGLRTGIRRTGIYAGTFDPVHAGHIAFALQAMNHARLDTVYFLPERRPRQKRGVEHFGHRVAMLRRATKPHPKFGVLELDDIEFSVARTLPKLRKLFTGDQLVFLLGSDAATHLPEWPQTDRLLRTAELVVGCREGVDVEEMMKHINRWSVRPLEAFVFTSHAPGVSSGLVREALRCRQPVRGVLKSVERYSDRNWLYISLAET